MSNENELLEPLATEAGQQAIARAINNLGSLENAVRAERAAATATQKADEARNSAEDASDYATEARNWANKTDGYVAQETITIPPEQEGDEPTTETIDLYSAKYYVALAQDIYNNLSFDTEPTENSTALVSSGAIYTALNGKADKSDTYTKTEVDTALSNVQGQLTFDNVPTANSDNPVKSSGIKTALDGKQDTLTFDSTPTANSTNPVTSGGVYTALQNVNIDIDDEITEDSDNPVTSAAIYEALQNFTPSGGGGGAGNASGIQVDVLYDNSSGIENGTITLDNDWNNYDIINVVGGTGYYSSFIYTKDKFEEIKGNSTKYLFLNTMSDSAYYCSLRVPNNSQIEVVQGANNHKLPISKVYGIKFSKNLSEQMYSNVLYENSSGIRSGTIALSDDWNNYDFISVEVWDANNGNAKNQSFYAKEFLENCYNDSKYLITIRYHEAQIYYKPITDYKTFSIGGSGGGCKLYKIIGYKLAKGGYSGIVSDARMTVKGGTYTLTESVQANVDFPLVQITFDSPMPDNNYEVLLTKHSVLTGGAELVALACNKTVNGFQIKFVQTSGTAISGNGVDWIAIRPNSYTREGMVEDVLFSNASGVNSGTINLSGNISDYDLIEIYRFANDNKELYSSVVSSSDLLQRNSDLLRYVAIGDGNNYTEIYCPTDSSIVIRSISGEKITKITGIKFGRYVSGVAVDTTVTQNSDAVVTSGAVYDALQNYTPSGGGSSITVDSTITQGGTNPVEGGAIYTALGDKADKSTTYTKTEVDTALGSKQGTLTFDTTPTADSTNPVTSGGVYTALQNLPTGTGDVTTNTDQNITGTKTFVGSKKVGFKQSAANDKLGFTLFGNTGTERGYLEFNPTNTVDGVAGLMTLGNYATSAAGLTQVGFRRYSNISGASGAYNLLMPMVADARTPFSLTTSYQNFYLPLGFTDGTTTVKTAKSGLVDLSPLLASLEARIAALEGN